MIGVIETSNRFEGTIQAQADLLENQTKIAFETMDRLEEEKTESIKKHSQLLTSEKKWSFLSCTTKNILTATTLVSGAYAVTQEKGKTSGMLMLASGVTSAVSSVFQWTGVYKTVSSWMTKSSELQDKIASRLEGGMQCLSVGLGLAGSVSAYRSGLTTTETAKNIGSKFTHAAGFIHGCLEYKKSSVGKDSRYLEASLIGSQTRITDLFQGILQKGKEAMQSIHVNGDLWESLKQMLSTLQPRT